MADYSGPKLPIAGQKELWSSEDNSSKFNISGYKREYYQKNKEKIKARTKKWREDNRDRYLETNHKYYSENKEKILTKTKEWQNTNKDRRKIIWTRYREKNIDRARANEAAYRERKREECNARIREWKSANKAKIAVYWSFRSKRARSALPAWADLDAIRLIYTEAKERRDGGERCHVDHIVPLVSKTVCGLHCEANLLIIPDLENMKKGNRYWPDMW